MEYFNKLNGSGFDYAYKFPGMNKVMQAAGRVIRTEQDRGIVVLIDDRFGQVGYKKLFPKEWDAHTTVKGVSDLREYIYKFWK